MPPSLFPPFLSSSGPLVIFYGPLPRLPPGVGGIYTSLLFCPPYAGLIVLQSEYFLPLKMQDRRPLFSRSAPSQRCGWQAGLDNERRKVRCWPL